VAAKKPAKKKPIPKKPYKPPVKTFKPKDYLSGSKKVGGKYKAWNTYNQGTPDMGKGAGPGEPYHVVTQTNTGKNFPVKTNPQAPPSTPISVRPRAGTVTSTSPYVAAIRRRLGWT
jgi:hypothetical protein